MLRAFVATALLLCLAFAALVLWNAREAQFIETFGAVAATSPDAKELGYSLTKIGSVLVAAKALVALSLGFALATSVWLLRPFTRRVAVGIAAAVLLIVAFVAFWAAASHRISLLRTTAAMQARPEASR